MTALRATFYFDVGELLADPVLLGTSHDLQRDNRRYVVTFPSEDEKPDAAPKAMPEELALRFPGRDEFPDIDGFAGGTTAVISGTSPGVAMVKTVCVDAYFDGSVSVTDFAANPQVPKASAAFDPTLTMLRELAAHGLDVVEEVLAWCRADGRQSWLGIGGQQITGVGSAVLVDLDAGRRLPVRCGLEADLVVTNISKRQVLSQEQLERYVTSVTVGDNPALGDVLRMDANYFLDGTGPPSVVRGLVPHDPRRAVLMAAIACEVQAKSVLEVHASGKPVAALIAAILGPGPPNVRAKNLFAEPMEAVAGISLETDDKVLFDRVGQLFTSRNKLAHRGHTPSGQEATDACTTARDAFVWLETKPGLTPRI